jgi:ATP-dependent DNA helicase DinG
MIQSPRTFAEAEANLVASLPGYESRPQQQNLARAVEDSVVRRTHLLAEAGCGTGKSLGYLIPAILSGKRVVISTATKALQDQVANKDVPFLAEHLGRPFTFALLKGRSNYLCINKVEAAEPGDIPSLARVKNVLAIAEEGFHGEREQLGFEVTDREWMQMAADTEDCQAFDCKSNGNCYAHRAKERALAADLVVVNHALYLTDMVVKEATGGNASLIGEHQVVIFDEAHEVEEYAGKTLGSTFKEGGVRGMVTEIRNFAHRYLPDHEAMLNEAGAEVLTAMSELWSVLVPGRIRQATLLEAGDEFVGFANALIGLVDALATKGLLENVPTAELEQVKKKRERLHRRAISTANRFHQVVTVSFDDLVRWVEKDGDKTVLKTAPVDVAPYLRDALFGRGEVVAILASATLSVGGKFDYIAKRLGIDSFDAIDVGTPFDYASQAAIYVPVSLPDPTKERAAWSNMATLEMMDLIKASGGRALVLFTSVTEMRQAYETLSARLPYRCLMQGQMANKMLAEEFKSDTTSVLFATKSFMTGVDFQGETCSLVIVNKMPFPVPTEPLTEARCEAIKRHGGNDFSEYTVPVMTLVLKQAFGRLIRHRNDTGIVAILDPRLQTKGYGKGIIKSLPESPLVTDFAGVERFYAEAQAVPA